MGVDCCGPDHGHAPPPQQHAHEHGGAPPAPTEEQLAFADAGFKSVPLALDAASNQLVSPTHDLTVLNALIRSLASLPPQLAFPPPPNVVPPQRSMAVAKAKEDGVAAFAAGNLSEAIRLFTLAIDVAASRPLWENNAIARDELALCLANRAAAFLEAHAFLEALADAEAVVQLKKPWSKGHFRKGKALHKLGRREEAKEAFELGLCFDPESTVSAQARRSAASGIGAHQDTVERGSGGVRCTLRSQAQLSSLALSLQHAIAGPCWRADGSGPKPCLPELAATADARLLQGTLRRRLAWPSPPSICARLLPAPGPRAPASHLCGSAADASALSHRTSRRRSPSWLSRVRATPPLRRVRR
jgi:translocation protein SEC72